MTRPGPQGAPPIDPCDTPGLTATVLICTYNRARSLGPTLDTIAASALSSPWTWEVLVVDNNSSDDTREVVRARAASFPVPLRYLFEPRQGKSNALNTGMRDASARVIVFTDDDVRVPPGWLDAAVTPLLAREAVVYTGGPVRPIWGGAPPAWLDPSGNLGGTIAVKDHGTEPFVFEDQRKTPLGVTLAFRREAFAAAGMFDPDTGRRAGTLLGQEVREWCIRARKAGLRGFYVPEMHVEHIIPADRLTKSYFRRWFYWRGISRARLYERSGLDMEAPEQTQLDFTTVPHVLGTPRYLYGKAARAVTRWFRATLRRDRVTAFEQELWICFFAGIVRQRWQDVRARRLRTRPVEGAAGRAQG